MRIAQSWLTEILQRATDGWSVSPAELDAGFVRVGLEVEGEPETLPEITGPLTIGRVSSIEELEGFKKPVRFCLVEVGGEELRRDDRARSIGGARPLARSGWKVRRTELYSMTNATPKIKTKRLPKSLRKQRRRQKQEARQAGLVPVLAPVTRRPA